MVVPEASIRRGPSLEPSVETPPGQFVEFLLIIIAYHVEHIPEVHDKGELLGIPRINCYVQALQRPTVATTLRPIVVISIVHVRILHVPYHTEAKPRFASTTPLNHRALPPSSRGTGLQLLGLCHREPTLRIPMM